jgi:recombinational DNA repair protein RecR|tara:strand:- start:210 stop:461 length:252 start_codon:yes stop_codon:yes gene_type:complete
MNDDTLAQKKYLPVTERLENNHPVAQKIKLLKKYKKHQRKNHEPKRKEKTKVKYCNVCCNGMYVYEQVFCETCSKKVRQKGEN